MVVVSHLYTLCVMLYRYPSITQHALFLPLQICNLWSFHLEHDSELKGKLKQRGW